MPSEVDTSNWSGEGTFTHVLLAHLKKIEAIQAIRVDDAPATRSEADYNFISNEIFVAFATATRAGERKRFGFLPSAVTVKSMALSDLEALLAGLPDVGAPDYSDDGMLQYLRTERIIPPYQTRGYKLVELVRLYEAGTPSRT